MALHHIGLYYGEKGQSERAIEVFKHALALGGLAESYKRSGQTAQAVDYYRRFVRARPDMAAGHFNLAALLIKKQNLPEAIVSLKQGVALEDHHPGSWYKLAQLYRTTAQAPQAEDAIRNALALSQTARDYWIEYGNIAFLYRRLEQCHKALAIYEEVTRAIPAYSPAHFNLGVLQYRQGRYAEAVASLRQVVQLSPEDEEAHRALAQAMNQMENSVFALDENAGES